MATQIALRLKDLAFQSLPGGDRSTADGDRWGNKGRSAIEKWTVVLYVLASSSAVLAIAGGVALMFGAADFREAAGETLGGAGPAVVGGALIAVLGIPMVSASSALYRNTRNAGRVAVGAGLVLLALIAIDAIVVGQFTWIYLPLGAVGLAMFAGGTYLRRLVNLDRSRPAVTTTDVRDAPPAVELDNPTERQRDRWANDGGRLTPAGQLTGKTRNGPVGISTVLPTNPGRL